jgi:hypothetical protein
VRGDVRRWLGGGGGGGSGCGGQPAGAVVPGRWARVDAFVLEKVYFSSLKYCNSVVFNPHVLFGANQSLTN